MEQRATSPIAVWSAGAPFLDATLRHLDERDAVYRVLGEELADADFLAAAESRVLIVGGCPVTGDVLRRLPGLELLVRAGVGVDKIDLATATERGVQVTNITDYCVEEVADHALLLLLAAARRLSRFTGQSGANWAAASCDVPVRRLSGRTCGLVGLGAIGSAVARRVAALGMAVLAHDPWVAQERFDAAGAVPVPLDELLERSDVISLHVPATRENHHLLDAAAFARMRRAPIVVNTARGGLVDTHALERALESGQVSGAGLDVLDEEPDVTDQLSLLRRDDVVVTPHVAWYSEDAREQLGRTAAEIALEYGRTGTVHRVLDPEVARVRSDQRLPDFPMTRESPLDPPDGYRRAREAGGLARVRLWDGRVAWLVTGYAEVRSLLRDPRISADRSHPGFPYPSPGRATLEQSGRTFVTMDPPDHGRLRRVFTRYFSVKRIEAFRPLVTDIVDELVTGIEDEGPPVDLVTRLAREVPARTICRVLGMPVEDRFRLQTLDNERNTLGTSPDAVERATDEMLRYVEGLVADKQHRPDEGVVSALVHEQLAEGNITRDELVPAIRLLITAGHETTTNMIGLGVLTLLRNPEQLAMLRADPTLVPQAVEELLRYISVFHISPTRVATDTVELGGQVIAAGDGVIPVVAGANRDGVAFPDPDAFDIRREARHHVAFGYGVHQCLGQALARVELQVVFETLFRRLPTLRLAVPADRLTVKEYAFLSLVELPVTWDEGVRA